MKINRFIFTVHALKINLLKINLLKNKSVNILYSIFIRFLKIFVILEIF